MQRISFGIVIAALLVSAPRLTLSFLLGDGIPVDPQIEIAILTVSGIGSGVVLTIGNAVLAHALAVKAGQRSGLWWLEACAWLLFLLGAVILVSPTLVVGLQRSVLAAVLTPSQAWLWAITAVVIVELLVGACMAASILASEPAAPPPPTAAKPSLLSRVSDVLVTKLERSLVAPPPSLHPVADVTHPNNHNTPVRTDVPAMRQPPLPTDSTAPRTNGNPAALPPSLHPIATVRTADDFPQPPKDQIVTTMLALYRHNPHATLGEVGQQIGRTKSTVSRYLAALEQHGKIVRNGNGVQVVDPAAEAEPLAA